MVQGNYSEDPPVVVMIVYNAFEHDTRVFKEASSLVNWGCKVHIVCIQKGGLPSSEVQQGILIHRVACSGKSHSRFWKLILAWHSNDRLAKLVAKSNSPKAAPNSGGKQNYSLRTTLFKRLSSVWPNTNPRCCQSEAWPTGIKWIPRLLGKIYFFAIHKPVAILNSLRVSLKHRNLKVHTRRWLRCCQSRVWPVGTRWICRLLGKIYLWGIYKPTVMVLHPATRITAHNICLAHKALSFQPDIIQSHDLNALTAGVITKRLCQAPLIYDSHELFLERNIGNGAYSRRMDNVFWAPIERRCITYVDATLSVAQGICDWLQKRYHLPPQQVHLIRNVQPYTSVTENTQNLQNEFGLPTTTPVGIYAGAITFNRGLEQLIDSAAYLKHGVYVIMGYALQPAYLESLKNRAIKSKVLDQRVFFKDAVPMPEVVQVVASAQVSIIPTQNVCLSYYFEASNKIFHSLMADTPVAMSDHAEKRMIVEQYGVGVLFDETDPKAIARAFEQFVTDTIAYPKAVTACRAASQTLNWQHEEYTFRSVYKGFRTTF